MTTKEVADQLVAMCRAGKNVEAVNALMSADVVSVEAMGNETMPATISGLDVIRGKNEWWIANHKVHSASVKGPFPNADRFAVIFNYEVTPSFGPGAGKRMRMEEVGVYTVTNGKISREEFFYDMTGASAEPDAAKPAKKKARAKPKVRAKAKKAEPKAKAKAKARVSKPKARAKAKARSRRR